ncbi:MAG: hypothetical protein Q9224_006101 [Gallowayella concinna]
MKKWRTLALHLVVFSFLSHWALSKPLFGVEAQEAPFIQVGTEYLPSPRSTILHTDYSKSSIEMERSILHVQRPSSFTFSQIIEDAVDSDIPPGQLSLQTQGEIHVRVQDASPGQRGIWVETEMHANYHSLAKFKAVQSGDAITISTPRKASASSVQANGDATLYLSSTIKISRGLALSSFNIHADCSNIIVHEGAPIPNHTPTSFIAPSSSVDISGQSVPSRLTIEARNTKLTTQSGSVNGDFTLHDTLTIHTQSGSININLSLESSINATTPATLDLYARSGSIKVNTPTILTPSKIPNRDFQSTLRTHSGSINAILVHGSTTLLRSDSSSIHASLHPHGDPSKRSDLTTRVLSGSSDITVLPSLTKPLAPLGNFYASHHGISGSIRVLYPGQWEGTVEGTTVSGSIRVNWPGLKILEDKSGWGSHSLKAVKGSGEGIVEFKDISGSVELKGLKASPVTETKGEAPVEESQRAVDDDLESMTDGGPQRVLTPGSEAGDEWVFVQ